MFLRSAAVCIAMGLSTPVLAGDCLPYEPATVTIFGALSMGHGYGPPGFGEDPEHDEKEEYGLLTLDKATCVSGGDGEIDEDVESIGALQLVPDGNRHLDRQLLGARIAVSGTLFHIVSGGHTEVMILYTDVHRAP